MHISEEKNSKINSSIDELSSPPSFDERDPLISDQQRKQTTTLF